MEYSHTLAIRVCALQDQSRGGAVEYSHILAIRVCALQDQSRGGAVEYSHVLAIRVCALQDRSKGPCKRSQQVTTLLRVFWGFWPTMLCPFAWALSGSIVFLPISFELDCVFTSVIPRSYQTGL